MASLLVKIKNFLRNHKINQKNRDRLKKRDISLIASNCNGACILHELGMEFNSPFVNLWVKPGDFIKLCFNFREYMAAELTFTKEKDIKYPVGMLKDIKIYFLHYKTEKDALNKWNQRKNRINYDNLYFLFTDRDGCTLEHLEKFDSLPYKGKVVFVHETMPQIKSAIYIPGFEDNECVGQCMDYVEQWSLDKYYDKFDYVEWINSYKIG